MAVDRPASREAEKNISPQGVEANRNWAGASMLSSMAIAIIIHILIALVIGSYVVFEGIVPVPFFESDYVDTGTSVIDDTPALVEEEPLPNLPTSNVETVQQVTPGGESAPDMSDLIVVSSAATTAGFTMPTTGGTPGMISSNLFGSGSGSGAGKGSGQGKLRLGSIFGSRGNVDGALTGYLYDFKKLPDGDFSETGMEYIKGGGGRAVRNTRSAAYRKLLAEFLDGWKTKILEKHFKADVKLSVTQIIMPNIEAEAAPAAFNVEGVVDPAGWAVLYQGEISPPHSGMFRFAGLADDVLLVRVDGDIVLDASIVTPTKNGVDIRQDLGPSWRSTPMWGGEWIRMRSGQKYPIEILIGEVPGGFYSAFLLVQEKGVTYERHPLGYLILPPFQLAPTEIPDYREDEGFRVLPEGLLFGVR
jgi:hypothetical protein